MFRPSLVSRRVITNLIRIGTQLCGDEFNQILWRDFRGAEWPARDTAANKAERQTPVG